ncbi:MAG: Exopolysaccharide export protein/domain GumC/Wzc1 [Thermodesulfobacterium sp.]|uniref:Exopolysaccharide export protein/domain GumC/Wzc1 n=1 Tax=Candidatus Thermodesulfobacterium syntrophicum TaxID=3060442 RepID=A0AAE3NZR4_9BACT|nr:Exopolysaccharide export protein/domain GumC/Wzc1 [Candidatus Thermodesulfobacterium syntrophicum]
MNPQQIPAQYEDEINLYDLWKVIVKRKKLIIGLFVIAILASAIISLLMPKIYRGEAVLKLPTKEPQASELINIIGKIDTKEDIKRIFPNTAHLITDVKLKEIKVSRNQVSKDKFLLIIEAKDKNILTHAFTEFITYLNNLPFIKRSVEEERQRLLIQLEEIDKLIAKLTKNIKTYKKLFETGKITLVGFNPIELEKSILDLKVRKIAIKQALNRLKGVEMLEEPRISENPVKPKIMLNIAIAGISSLFVGIFLAFFIESITKMKSKDNET